MTASTRGKPSRTRLGIARRLVGLALLAGSAGLLLTNTGYLANLARGPLAVDCASVASWTSIADAPRSYIAVKPDDLRNVGFARKAGEQVVARHLLLAVAGRQLLALVREDYPSGTFVGGLRPPTEEERKLVIATVIELDPAYRAALLPFVLDVAGEYRAEATPIVAGAVALAILGATALTGGKRSGDDPPAES